MDPRCARVRGIRRSKTRFCGRRANSPRRPSPSAGGESQGVAHAASALYVPRRVSMPSSPSLTSTLEERTGLNAGDFATREPPVELEPLPSLLPPEGVVASRLADAVSRVRSLRAGKLDVS